MTIAEICDTSTVAIKQSAEDIFCEGSCECDALVIFVCNALISSKKDQSDVDVLNDDDGYFCAR
jgi:hypothetical protein